MNTSTFIPLAERCFDLIDGALWVFAKALTESGLSEQYYRKEKSEGSKRLQFIDHPNDNRFSLVLFESMSATHRKKIEERFGNPYTLLVHEPIKKMVVKDVKAHEFYMQYRFDGNKSLPIEKINEYTTAASWLNMLIEADANKKEIKKLLNLSIADFFIKVGEIITADKIALPASYRNLKPKIEQYKNEGYSCIIHKQTGNKNNLKVNSELAESILIEILSRPHIDDITGCRAYNQWATDNAHEQITPMTVRNWKRKHSFSIVASKEGNASWYNKFGKQIQRNRPSGPLKRVESDDNILDLYFQTGGTNKKGNNITNYFKRVSLIVVMDTFNDYILGYAYTTEEITADLVRKAYLNAVHHIKSLTGNYYLAWDGATDRWGQGTLDEFYQSIFANYIPATARAPRGKYIERAFGKKWHQLLAVCPNYSGFNITAKTKLNRDFVDLNKKDFPTIEQAPKQVELFINALRSIVDEKTGLSKQQQWLQAFTNDQISQQRLINDMQMLLLFGKRHEHLNTITNKGITPAINCIERTYEVPKELFLETIGRKVQVIYDEYDYSRILITDNEGLICTATEYQKLSSTTIDRKEGEEVELFRRIAEKKDHVKQIAAAKEKRIETLQLNKIDVEGLLQSGIVLPKETKQLVEKVYHEQSNQFDSDREKWIDENNDFDEFFNQ